MRISQPLHVWRLSLRPTMLPLSGQSLLLATISDYYLRLLSPIRLTPTFCLLLCRYLCFSSSNFWCARACVQCRMKGGRCYLCGLRDAVLPHAGGLSGCLEVRQRGRVVAVLLRLVASLCWFICCFRAFFFGGVCLRCMQSLGSVVAACCCGCALGRRWREGGPITRFCSPAV